MEGLRNYEDSAQEAARNGIAVPEEVVKMIEKLYRDWMGQCSAAAEQIVALDGWLPRNFGKFRELCNYARNRIAAFDRFTTIDEALSGRLFTEPYIQEVERALSRESSLVLPLRSDTTDRAMAARSIRTSSWNTSSPSRLNGNPT